MTDLAHKFIGLGYGADLSMDGPCLAQDEGLYTAVIISLWTDARARDDDRLPLGQTDRRGWWGDSYPVVERDRFGSRLWLLRASKQLQESLNLARAYAEEALAWLVTDGVARKVEVETWIVRFEVMGLLARIYRPDGTNVPIRFEILWNALK